MKNKLIIGIIVLALVGFFYLRGSRGTTPTPPLMEESVNVTLDAVNNSNESGTATLTAEGAQTKVVLNLSGAPQDVAQPAHIHTGSCPGIGDVKYPLNFPTNGSSETLLDVSLEQLLSEVPLAINVHKSATEVATYVACGNIAP